MEKAYKFVLVLIILFLVAIALVPFMMGGPAGAFAIGVLTVPCGIIAGLLIAYYLTPSLWSRFSNGIYYSCGNTRPPPPEFPIIRSKIAKGELKGAEKELTAIIRKDAGNVHALSLLADLYLDTLHEPESSFSMLSAYFSSKEGRQEEDFPLLMKLLDSAIEIGKPELTQKIIEKEIKNKYRPVHKNALRKRLEALSEIHPPDKEQH